MALNDSINAASHNQAVAAQLQATMRRHKASMRSNGPKALGPGAKVVDAEPYLRNLHNQEMHASQMADVDLHPEKYLKEPRPGWRYAWISLRDTFAKGRVQSGRYREVEVDELLDEVNLAYEDGPLIKKNKLGTHKGAGRAVIQYDLQLVAISPENWKALFEVREAMGMKSVTQGIDEFYNRMEAEGASAEFEMTPVPA